MNQSLFVNIGTGMTSSIDRPLIIAMSFSLVVHLAGSGLVTILQPDSRKASHTAPVDIFQVTLQQIESLPPVEPEPVKKPEPITRPEPVVVAESVQKPKPLPVAKPVQKPVSRPRATKKPEKKTVSESIERQKRVASSPVKSQQRSVAKEAAASQKVDYFSLLQAHIEACKYYPRAARKQGIEGKVEVSFQLLRNGDVSDIQTSGAHRLLRHAAARAIKEALPLPKPPDSLAMPANIRFSMHYDLKG